MAGTRHTKRAAVRECLSFLMFDHHRHFGARAPRVLIVYSSGLSCATFRPGGRTRKEQGNSGPDQKHPNGLRHTQAPSPRISDDRSVCLGVSSPAGLSDIRLSVKRRALGIHPAFSGTVKLTNRHPAAVLAAKRGAFGMGPGPRFPLGLGASRPYPRSAIRRDAAWTSPQAVKVPHKRPQAPKTRGISAPGAAGSGVFLPREPPEPGYFCAGGGGGEGPTVSDGRRWI